MRLLALCAFADFCARRFSSADASYAITTLYDNRLLLMSIIFFFISRFPLRYAISSLHIFCRFRQMLTSCRRLFSTLRILSPYTLIRADDH